MESRSYDFYYFKVALRFSGVNFVSLNFIDYVSMALCMGDNRVGDEPISWYFGGFLTDLKVLSAALMKNGPSRLLVSMFTVASRFRRLNFVGSYLSTIKAVRTGSWLSVV